MRLSKVDIVSIFSLSTAGVCLLVTLFSLSSTKTLPYGGKKLAVKPFNVWDRRKRPFPCIVDNDNSTGGIYYVRIPRTSSKGVSVTRRIAGLEGRLLDSPEVNDCRAYAEIAPTRAVSKKFHERDKTNSFLWSMVRLPDRRALSHFGLRLRAGEVVATTEAFINDVENSVPYHPNVEIRFLSMEDVSADESEETYAGLVNDILLEYNFIGIEERMKESLVALSMVIGTNVDSVIYQFSRCISEGPPEWMTPGMFSYLESEKWMTSQAGDYILYNAVNMALDLTINRLNQAEYNARLDQFDIIMLDWTVASTVIKGWSACGAAFDGKHPADMNEWMEGLPPGRRRAVLDKRALMHPEPDHE